MEHITSRQNALMTHIRKLNASRAYRRASGEYLCDGVKLQNFLIRGVASATDAFQFFCYNSP